MVLKRKDWKILDKLELAIKPVGVSYLVDPPDSVEKLDEKMPLCGMLKKAQQDAPFYIDAASHACEAGAYVLGQEEIQQPFISGGFGAGLEVFKDKRAAARVYNYIPKIPDKVLNHVMFAALDTTGAADGEMDAPDITIILADTRQTWILMRALSYETGEKWEGHFSAVIGCAWLFAWPYLQGKVNVFATGLGFGMRRRGLFPEGLQFVAVPFDRWPSILRVLKEMPWTPEPFKPHGFEFVGQLRQRLHLD
jgi:uncharacterized protein (DUF169 family)